MGSAMGCVGTSPSVSRSRHDTTSLKRSIKCSLSLLQAIRQPDAFLREQKASEEDFNLEMLNGWISRRYPAVASDETPLSSGWGWTSWSVRARCCGARGESLLLYLDRSTSNAEGAAVSPGCGSVASCPRLVPCMSHFGLHLEERPRLRGLASPCRGVSLGCRSSHPAKLAGIRRNKQASYAGAGSLGLLHKAGSSEPSHHLPGNSQSRIRAAGRELSRCGAWLTPSLLKARRIDSSPSSSRFLSAPLPSVFNTRYVNKSSRM